MLNDAKGLRRVYLAPGYTDMRKGMDSLIAKVRFSFGIDPFERNTLFMFCGRKATKIKCILWEGDGWLMLTKRLEVGAFSWPRDGKEAMSLSPEQYRNLMGGLEVIAKRPITQIEDPPRAM